MTVKEFTDLIADKNLQYFNYNFKGEEDFKNESLTYEEFVQKYGNYNIYEWYTYTEELYVTLDKNTSLSDELGDTMDIHKHIDYYKKIQNIEKELFKLMTPPHEKSNLYESWRTLYAVELREKQIIKNLLN